MRTTILSALLLLTTVACDKRTPEEKGRDYADEKLGFVEGATGELQKRGKDIGTGLGKGVGDLVKGTGSAVKDVAHPPVKVVLSKEVAEAGLSVGQANEGSDAGNVREVIVHLKAKKPFSGKLTLEGKGEGNIEVRTIDAHGAELASEGTQIVHFAFDQSVRLSKISEFTLRLGTLWQTGMA
jgi:hypothetical protein